MVRGNSGKPDENDDGVALIASSRQSSWLGITVNGVRITPDAVAGELQYHPAENHEEALFLAGQALVIRELLRQRVDSLKLPVEPQEGETEEEAVIRTLIAHEVQVPQADEQSCRQFFESNRERFNSAPLLAVRHILLGCAMDDAQGRSQAREQAETLLLELNRDAGRFAELALNFSDCPSREQGGCLGQISKGQTVPEFERQLFRLPLGLAGQPVESRYGVHVVWIDQRLEGQPLPYEAVRDDIRDRLEQGAWRMAVRQYLQGLIGSADIRGIVLPGADSPLVQ